MKNDLTLCSNKVYKPTPSPLQGGRSLSFQILVLSKHRFIHIVDFLLILDIFVGQASDDFGPKLEQLDKLKIGEEITVYYDDKTPLQKSKDLRFNKTVQFIDKNGEAHFIRGNKDKDLFGR
ncbi:hypothetical protein [Mariniflexile sp.]|uniref:hypothetical protein n=1 Tax=Mariniflexile sp. TaxID=1979402 RepID=UPI0040478A05